MTFETSARQLWRKLAREERQAAALAFFAQPGSDVLASADAAIVRARKLRPQVARALPPAEKARVLATVLDPDEELAAALVVALHLGERRGLLAAFLDALGLPHENGLLKDDAEPVAIGEAPARRAVSTLAAAFPAPQVLTYLNALWLQDPERWSALERAPEWLG